MTIIYDDWTGRSNCYTCSKIFICTTLKSSWTMMWICYDCWWWSIYYRLIVKILQLSWVIFEHAVFWSWGNLFLSIYLFALEVHVYVYIGAWLWSWTALVVCTLPYLCIDYLLTLVLLPFPNYSWRFSQSINNRLIIIKAIEISLVNSVDLVPNTNLLFRFQFPWQSIKPSAGHYYFVFGMDSVLDLDISYFASFRTLYFIA